MAKHIITATSAPAVAPAQVGLHWLDTVAKKEYRSYGTSSLGDWVEVGAGGGGSAPATPLYIPSSSASYSQFDINLDVVTSNVIEVQPVSNCSVNLTFNSYSSPLRDQSRELFIVMNPGGGLSGVPQFRVNNSLLIPRGTVPDAGYEMPRFAFRVQLVGSNSNEVMVFAEYVLKPNFG
jgi:hypothetical protein